jgi:hypothetical protein
MSTLTINGGTGLTSCLSVRLDQTLRHVHQTGAFPDRIDSSKQFTMYRAEAGADVSEDIISPLCDATAIPIPQFDHGWQYAWYDEIGLQLLGYFASRICTPSGEVVKKYVQIDKGRCAILYRGNDKAKEIGRVEYGTMIEIAKATGYTSFHVQTDEQEFLDEFRKVFPDTTAWDHIPRIPRNLESYVIPIHPKDRPAFAQDFLAALLGIARAEALITNTGNTGLWAMLYRGHTRNTWQAHGKFGTWRKLKAE